MGDDVWMAFQEPRVLEFGLRDPASYSWPRASGQKKAELQKLFSRWEAGNRFEWIRGGQRPWEVSQVANVFKDESKDRQIIDRHARSGQEARANGGPAADVAVAPTAQLQAEAWRPANGVAGHALKLNECKLIEFCLCAGLPLKKP